MIPVAIDSQEPAMGVIRVKLTEEHDLDDVASYLETLHNNQLQQLRQFDELSDLENAMSNMALSVEFTGEGHRSRPDRIAKLGIIRYARFERLGESNDLENAIASMELSVDLTDDGHPHKPIYLFNLGNSRRARFELLGDQSDLEKAIVRIAKAVELTVGGHPDYLWNLSLLQEIRFECLGHMPDLDNSISNVEKVVNLRDDSYPIKHTYLSSLGNSLQTRFQHVGNMADLESAISNKEKAVQLTDHTHPDHPIYLTNLGLSQLYRFECLGNFSDLANSISNTQQAVALISDSHPSKPSFLLNLGNSQQVRFQYLGDLVDLENAILNKNRAVQLADDAHPVQPIYLTRLGNSQRDRLERLGNLADLERAKALELTDDRHPDWSLYLWNLGSAQLNRFEQLGFLSDLESAISNIEKATELTDDRHPTKPTLLTNLGSAQQTRFEQLGDLFDLEKAVSNIGKAIKLTGDGHSRRTAYLMHLSSCQQTRFGRLGDLTDLDNAISNIGQAVKLADDRNPSKPAYLCSLGTCQLTRFERLGNLADLENSILNTEKAIGLTNDGNPDRPAYLAHLGIAQVTRYEHQRALSDLENAISNINEAVVHTDDRHPKKAVHLSNLGSAQRTRFELLGNLSDLENAISNKVKAVQLTDDRHPNQPLYLSGLGSHLLNRFENLGDSSDLQNAILNQEKAVKLTDDSHPSKARWLLNYGVARQARFRHLGGLEDLKASISSLKAAAQSTTAYPSDSLAAARQWAAISHFHGDLVSAVDGYRAALALLPKVAWLGLDINSRQTWLLHENAENLGCLAATCAIQLGHLEEAVELLDLSRSVFWQQAASLRSDLELLREPEPKLAQELEKVGRQLDAGNFTAVNRGDIAEDGQNSAEEIGKERRRLVRRWEELVERVRQLPKFKYFLRPVPFHRLRQASTAGQVIIINASKYGVDALLFDAARPINHVPLPNVDLKILAEISGDVLLRRPVVATERAQRKYVTRYLKPSLRIVWDDILVPIFYKLDIPLAHSAVTPQRRIWWYPTGLLTFIPIHAAGPGTGATDAGRLVISSYITSLDMLLQAQNKNKQLQDTTSGPRLLAVSQPETSGLCPLPRAIVEVERLVHAFQSAAVHSDLEGYSAEDILYLNGSDATVNRVSGALDSCSWVHFACHGSQDLVFGMKSAFALYDGYLELGEIASKRLSSGQFAFLSACHAASGLKDLPGEAMHLAAGLQFAGFPSVIATMWSIRDDDAPKVADRTYQYLFRNGLHALDPSEAATALSRAILCLRDDPSITVDRWAPFIHFGI
jgi:tetratricopeptide (TPR) repeat protein